MSFINQERLIACLKANISGLSGNASIEQFSGGASNLTYKVSFNNRSLVLRRPPIGAKSKSAHYMHREFELQSNLKAHFGRVPEALYFCDDHSILGSDFYVMEYIEGLILHRNLPRGVSLSEKQAETLCYRFIDALIELHSIDISKPSLAKLGKGSGYLKRQVDGWTSRFSDAKTWNVKTPRKLINWIQLNTPKSHDIAMTHNDFKLDNVVLDTSDPTIILRVLDWELATIGDPLLDLGNLLAYWVEDSDSFIFKSSRRQPSHIKGMLKREEIKEYYCKTMGRDASDMLFYEVFGLFRLAVVAQQIYFRYHLGHTKNKEFRHLWVFVNHLFYRALDLLKQRRIKL